MHPPSSPAPSRRKRAAEGLGCFVLLFFLLALRTPADLFTPYLWAEDGALLIEDSIFFGADALFIPGNGAYWFLQRFLALLCYWAVSLSGSLAALPYVMQVVFKSAAVLGILYFMSGRFAWLVARRRHRFFICAGILLLIPCNASDVLTCDTSLPFHLLFPAFLIGLDGLCSGKNEMLTWGQTLFLCVLALSTLAAPFLAAIAGLCALLWFITQKRAGTLTRSAFLLAALKLALVCAATLFQLRLALGSGRVSAELALGQRLWLNTRQFLFFPYWDRFHSWLAFAAGLLLWALLLRLVKLPRMVLLYSTAFSYFYLLFCSLTTDAHTFYNAAMSDPSSGRFVLLGLEIAALLLGVVVSKLLERPRQGERALGFLLGGTMALGGVITYPVAVMNAGSADAFVQNIALYDADGPERVWIPVGPWPPWTLEIPADVSAQPMIDDVMVWLESVDDTPPSGGDTIYLSAPAPGTYTRALRGHMKAPAPCKHLLVRSPSFPHPVCTVSLTPCDNTHSGDENCYFFHFDLPHDALPAGATTLAFYAQTQDGRWHRGELALSITLH